jgi:hypothetical protein
MYVRLGLLGTFHSGARGEGGSGGSFPASFGDTPTSGTSEGGPEKAKDGLSHASLGSTRTSKKIVFSVSVSSYAHTALEKNRLLSDNNAYKNDAICGEKGRHVCHVTVAVRPIDRGVAQSVCCCKLQKFRHVGKLGISFPEVCAGNASFGSKWHKSVSLASGSVQIVSFDPEKQGFARSRPRSEEWRAPSSSGDRGRVASRGVDLEGLPEILF